MKKILMPSLLLPCLLLVAVGLHAGEPLPAPKTDFFPVSVWYSGGKARAPMLSVVGPASEAEWRADLQQIKALGFNAVRTWVEWAACEPQRGQYNFDNLRLLLRLAGEAGLRVLVQMYVDSAPDWVAAQFPHALFEAQSGHKVVPQAAPGACTDNRDVEEAVLNFYTQAARVASEYDSFFAWDLWSEPHIINWASLDYIPNVQFCFCPGTRARFRSWLHDRYGSLEMLNRAWYRNFSGWDQVDPPRFSTILSYTDFIDWKRFIYEKLADDMRARYEAIRRGGSAHLITAHAVGASLFQSPHVGAGATDDFLMARTVDYYGVSLYPKHNHPDRAWSVTTLRTVMDFTRSANRESGGWYVGELQAGMGTIALLVSDPVTADDHRIWIWSAIAKGAKAINIYAYYPMSSGYEAGGYGLVDLDGTMTGRAVSAGELAAVVDRNQGLFLGATPARAQVAIVYNPLAQMVGGMQRRDYPGALTNSLIGYFQTFANHNIPVDFIHRDHLEAQQLSQYRLVIVPFPIMFTRAAAEGLRQFVDGGGHVLAEARLAWNDDRGHAAEVIPGLGLHELFGAREDEVRMRADINLNITAHQHPALNGLQGGDALKGSLYLQSLAPLQGRALDTLAVDDLGQPVLVSSRYGNGQAMLAGTYLGMGNFPEVDPLNDIFMTNLIDWAGVERPFTTSHDGKTSGQVEVRLQHDNHGSLLFVINHSDATEEVVIDLRVGKDGTYRVREVITETASRVAAKDGVLQLSTRIGPKQVVVWEVR